MTPQSKGAKEKLLTRIIVSRCEVDLKRICSEYKANFGQSVQKTILVNKSYRLLAESHLLDGVSRHATPLTCSLSVGTH